jgi:hypothetical protein
MAIHRKLLRQCAGILMSLPILYTAASGPMLRVNLGQPLRPYLEAFYKPLDEITTATRTNQFWRKYLGWWGGYYRLEVYDISQVARADSPAAGLYPAFIGGFTTLLRLLPRPTRLLPWLDSPPTST